MKNTTMRKLAGIAAIVTLASCMMAPMGMTAFAVAESYSITINNDVDGHTYEAYQIFTGKLENGVLSNIVWGDGISADGQTALGDASTYAGTITDANADDIATELADYLATVAASDDSVQGGYVLNVEEPGYYLVVDKVNNTVTGSHDAYSSYILQVLGTETISPKSAYPVVDKQVFDDNDSVASGDNDGWGETADHEINESFQFKLIATITGDPNYAFYETYKIVFNDTMSEGVTFESIEDVTVNGNSVADGKYAASAVDDDNSFTVTIADLLTAVDGVDLTTGTTTVEVIYNAHLNSNAEVTTTNGDTDNANTVYLEYSNNPNWDGEGEYAGELGETPEDTVWVYTYKIENTKVNGSKNKEALNGAGFRLYDSTGNTEIPVIWDATLNAYRLAIDNEVGVEMVSANDGSFDIAGLDVGTYILKETTTPEGFNTCGPTTIKISATHSENADKAASTATLSAESTMQNEIINNEGSSLPSTGGIGTTLFYVIGGTMAAGAGVYLISKKRMNKED